MKELDLDLIEKWEGLGILPRSLRLRDKSRYAKQIEKFFEDLNNDSSLDLTSPIDLWFSRMLGNVIHGIIEGGGKFNGTHTVANKLCTELRDFIIEDLEVLEKYEDETRYDIKEELIYIFVEEWILANPKHV